MSIMIFALTLLSMIHALSDENLQIEVRMSMDKNLIGSMEIVSPQCRQSAIGIFSDLKSMGYKNNNWCRELTYFQQQHLALELTKCHLDELMQDTFEVSPCTSSVQECLTQLTPQGVQCYTLFHLHVEQYCIRLNQEWMIAQQYETTQQLQHVAQRATEQWTSWLNQHDNLTMDVKQILGGLRNEYLEWHETHWEVTSKQQQMEMEQYLKSIMKDTWNDQLQPMKLVVQFWKDWTSNVSNAVAQSSWMWNFVSSLFLDGFDIAYGIVYTMVELLFQWIITQPKFLHTCRRILWSISLLEFSVLFIWKIICACTLMCTFKYDLMSHVRIIGFGFQVVALISCLLNLFRWKRRVTPVDPINTTDMVVTLEMMKIALNRVQHQLHSHEKQLEESSYRGGILANGTIDIDPFVSHYRRRDAPYPLPGRHGHVNEFMPSPMTRRNLNSNFISPEGMNATVSSTILSYPERRFMAGDNHGRSSFLPVVDNPIVHSGDTQGRTSFLPAIDNPIVHSCDSLVHDDDDVGVADDDDTDDDDTGDDCDDTHESICQDSCASIATTTEAMNQDVLHGETNNARLSQTMKKKRQPPDGEELEPAPKRQHCEDTVIL